MKRFAAASLALVLVLVSMPAALTQTPGVPAMPNFWDPKRRPERPPPLETKTFRFLTEGRFAPLNFKASDGTLVGFEVDLARLICEELSLTCTIQTRAWEELLPALVRGEADAVIAGMAISPETRRAVEFSNRYLGNPARFVGRKDVLAGPAVPERLSGRKVGVVEGTAHARFLELFFSGKALDGVGATRVPFPSRGEALEALRSGEVEAVFADAVNLSNWLNGEDSGDCCRFLDGAYTESAFFGEGLGIALPKGRETVRKAINTALSRIHARGLYDELYLRYFPLGLY